MASRFSKGGEHGPISVGGAAGPSGGDGELAAVYQREFSEFLYVVTHDLRSPLANIRGLAAELRLALQDLEPLNSGDVGALSAEVRARVALAMEKDIPETLAHIDSCVSRADRLMNRLVEFSRIANAELALAPVELAEIVGRSLDRLAGEIREKSCSVEVGELPRVRADAIAMERIFDQLIGNALKFLSTDRPGKLRIFSSLDERGRHAITVADNGRGIAEKDLLRLFAPFRKAGKADLPGDGMGLAIVKALARRHRGTVSCASALGEGSAFTVTLPQAAF